MWFTLSRWTREDANIAHEPPQKTATLIAKNMQRKLRKSHCKKIAS